MSEIVFYDTMRASLWAACIASAPVLMAALVVGLVIGLFQALTSIQEMTLTFVPKMAAILATFWMTMGFMTSTLTDLFHGRLLPLIRDL